MSSPRIYRTRIHYGIEKYLKSLRFWENQIWTSHKFSNARFILREECLLHAFLPDKRAFLEVEKIHFSGPQASKGQLLLMWKPPKDKTSASLDMMRAHKIIFEHTMESHLSLGSPSIMYQGREEGFEAHLCKPTKIWTKGDHKALLAKISQATPASCVTQGVGEKEDSMVGYPTSLSTTAERERVRLRQKAELEGQTSLHRDLEPLPRGPLASG